MDSFDKNGQYNGYIPSTSARPSGVDGKIRELDADVEAMVIEIARLQERVLALEKAREQPDNSFWGQLLFDVFVFLTIVANVLLWR